MGLQQKQQQESNERSSDLRRSISDSSFRENKCLNKVVSHLELHEVTQGAHDLDDLLGKLAGGREHERLALGRGGVDLLEDRHGEGGGLTGTCDVKRRDRKRCDEWRQSGGDYYMVRAFIFLRDFPM